MNEAVTRERSAWEMGCDRGAPNLVTNSIAQIQSLYSGVGVLVELVSTEVLTPRATAPAAVAVGGSSGKTTPAQNTLFGNRNGVGANDVVAYFVTATIPSFNGYATHPAGRDGAIVRPLRTTSRWPTRSATYSG